MEKNVVFMLTQTPSKTPPYFPPSVTITGMSKVIDIETGEERILVYNPASNTIWGDKMTNLKDKDYPKFVNIKFINGFRTVSSKEQNLLKFLRLSGCNEANNETRVLNSVLFREINAEKKASNTLDDVRLLDNARYFASNADIKEVRLYALALAKNAGEIAQLQQMSDYEVRLNLRFKAEKNPIAFLENMKDQVLINKVKIIQAIYNDTIVLNESNNTLSWKNGNEFLVPPLGMDVVKYLSEMSVKHEKYANLLNDIITASNGESKEIIGKKENHKANSQVQDKIVSKHTESPSLSEEENEDKEDVENIIERLIDVGVLEVSTNKVWHTFKRGTPEERKFKRYLGFRDALKNDVDFKAKIDAILN